MDPILARRMELRILIIDTELEKLDILLVLHWRQGSSHKQMSGLLWISEVQNLSPAPMTLCRRRHARSILVGGGGAPPVQKSRLQRRR